MGPKRLTPMAMVVTGVLAFGLSLSEPGVASGGTPVPGAPNCPMFPADNVWSTDIAGLPVDAHSAAWLTSMHSATTNLHPDFGPSGDPSNPYGMPFTVVSPSHPLVHLSFQYAAESDPGPYPFGADTPIEGGQQSTGDRHAIMVNPSTCTLYELYDAHYSSSGSTAGSGAIWNLNSDALRPSGWTSADAAGLPILPGLLRYDEVQSGVITHAIRMTAQTTDTSFVWPARHEAGASSNPNLPPMGARFRLKGDYDISGFSPQAQVVLRAMQHYGLILADNGSNWYFGGTADPAWPIALVDELKGVPASAFEAVDESSLMVNPDSGQARQGGGAVAVNCGSGPGYRLVAADGGVFSFCSPYAGSAAGMPLAAAIVGTVATLDDGGYYMVAADGGVFTYGDATYYGSTGALHLNQPIVGMAAAPDGRGYWLVASDGGIFAFGSARFLGSTGNLTLNKPIVGMAASPDGRGYWLVASDGGVFTFGTLTYFGSMGGHPLNQPIVATASSPDGGGYLLVAADGGVFTFGDAVYRGSTGAIRLNRPIVGMTTTGDGAGYWLVASDGGVFNFGDALFHGSTGAITLAEPIVAMSG
ncbi:MAG TPA: hypothetical protein VNG12_24520 [Acidimicrobiales bacterium]|nr:hypothetical protein [Acidimicrobiales bacterium]